MWALKIEEGGSVAGTGSLNWFVQSYGASEKLWRVAISLFPPLFLGVSRQLACEMASSQRRVTRLHCHVQWLSNACLKNS